MTDDTQNVSEVQDAKKTIVVWFSCGAASAVAAKMTLDKYRDTHIVRIVNNPILEEGEDNPRFLRDVEKWLDHPIEFAINPRFPNCSTVEVFDVRGYMSGVLGAPCTVHLKKEARQIWEKNNPHDFIVMGFTAEEAKRHERFCLTERDTVIPVLIRAGITKQRCFEIISEARIELPDSYRDGFPNANCRKRGCVKATSATYWSHHKKMEPEGHAATCEQSRRIGAKLVRYKGQRIFLDELPDGAQGRAMKAIKMPDCGIFCEEKS